MADRAQGEQTRFEVLVATSEARDYAEQGRFPDGSYCRWCDGCDVGSPECSWVDDRCPDCGKVGGAAEWPEGD